MDNPILAILKKKSNSESTVKMEEQSLMQNTSSKEDNEKSDIDNLSNEVIASGTTTINSRKASKRISQSEIEKVFLSTEYQSFANAVYPHVEIAAHCTIPKEKQTEEIKTQFQTLLDMYSLGLQVDKVRNQKVGTFLYRSIKDFYQTDGKTSLFIATALISAIKKADEICHGWRKLCKTKPFFPIYPDNNLYAISRFQNLLVEGTEDEDGLRSGIIDNVPRIINALSGADKDESLTTQVNMYFAPEDEKLKLVENRISGFENTVLNAIITIKMNGRSACTPLSILRVMEGNKKIEAEESQIERVVKAIEKLRSIHVKIDCTAEAQKRGIKNANGKPIQNMTYDHWLLDMPGITLDIEGNGKIMQGYEILDKSVAISYVKMTNQVIPYSSTLLTIKNKDGKVLYTSEDKISIRTFLIKEIELMKHNGFSNRKAFDDIFSKLSIVPKNRMEKSRLKKYIIDCLEHWSREGYIKGIAFDKVKGKEGIVILLEQIKNISD